MTRQSALARRAQEYVEDVQRRVKPATWYRYRYHLSVVEGLREEFGLPGDPRRWGEHHLMTISNELRARYSSNSVRTMMRTLGAFLRSEGIWVMDKAMRSGHVRLPPSERSRVRWHSPGERLKLLEEPEPVAKIVMVLGYYLGLRVAEITDLRLSDIYPDVVRVQGKFGKVRHLPLEPLVANHLEHYIRTQRVEVVQKAIEKGWMSSGMPEELILRNARGRLGGYTEDGLRKMLARHGKRVGILIGPHDMRRTFGRELHRRGVDIEYISQLLGHSSSTVTRLYLGIDVDDMREALKQYYTDICTEEGRASAQLRCI